MVINFKWLIAVVFLTLSFSLHAQIDNNDKKPLSVVKKSQEAKEKNCYGNL